MRLFGVALILPLGHSMQRGFASGPVTDFRSDLFPKEPLLPVSSFTVGAVRRRVSGSVERTDGQSV
jgi:hypothetical protein